MLERAERDAAPVYGFKQKILAVLVSDIQCGWVMSSDAE
jgi:hypothetical protein